MIHLYCRVSSAGQAREEKTSLEQQERACRAIATLHGETNPTVWIDAGISGSLHLAKRPEGKKLLEALQPGDTLIATKMDRVFRNTRVALEMATAFEDQGIALILPDIGGVQPLGSSPTGKMFFTVLAAITTYELDMINERTAEGKAARAAKGGSVNRPPYGWKTVDKMRVADEHEMMMVRFMRRLYAGGKNFNEITKALAKRGYKNRLGKRMDPRQVAAILRRPEHPAELEFEKRRKAPNGEPVAVAMPYGDEPIVLPPPPPPPKTKEEIAMDKLRASVAGERLLEDIINAPSTDAYQRARETAAERLGWKKVNQLTKTLAEFMAQV